MSTKRLRGANAEKEFGIVSKMTYDGGKLAGSIAKQYRVVVGEIGCPHCGLTTRGAIYSATCTMCGNDLFSPVENKQSKS